MGLFRPLTNLWNQVLKEYRRRGKIAICVLILVYLMIGTSLYRNAFGTDWSVVDAGYFTMVTISTVGYGDFSPGPDQPGMQVFTIFYILVGITVVFPQLSLLMNGVLVLFRKLVLIILDRLYDTAETAGVSGRSSGMSGKAVDVSGDGKADFVAPPPGHVFWTQELLPASLLWMIIQLASAAIFTQVGDGRITNFGNAFYHCCITATTCARALPTRAHVITVARASTEQLTLPSALAPTTAQCGLRRHCHLHRRCQALRLPPHRGLRLVARRALRRRGEPAKGPLFAAVPREARDPHPRPEGGGRA